MSELNTRLRIGNDRVYRKTCLSMLINKMINDKSSLVETKYKKINIKYVRA